MSWQYLQYLYRGNKSTAFADVSQKVTKDSRIPVPMYTKIAVARNSAAEAFTLNGSLLRKPETMSEDPSRSFDGFMCKIRRLDLLVS